jgi:hypothetical protein
MNATAVRGGNDDNMEERCMESNDYWTHVSLATAFFIVVVGPRLFSPGHTANSLTYIVGAMVVIVAATVARRGTKATRQGTAGEK